MELLYVELSSPYVLGLPEPLRFPSVINLDFLLQLIRMSRRIPWTLSVRSTSTFRCSSVTVSVYGAGYRGSVRLDFFNIMVSLNPSGACGTHGGGLW